MENLKLEAENHFKTLRDRICDVFEKIEADYAGPEADDLPPGKFERKSWFRNEDDSGESGGGVMSVMRGRVFEKVGVNFSAVRGEFPPEFASQIPGAESDPNFYAAGISLVAHPRSPKVPAAHMNTRHIVTQKSWFGGGGDLNPALPNDEDTAAFHAAFKAACDSCDPDYYEKFKQWCDEYFYIKHRKESRGVGGIFYDYLYYDTAEAAEKHFDFTKKVGYAFKDVYSDLVRKHMNKGWTKAEKETQLIKRGRYAEFNLIYDRGTLFGLKTGGNIEAILMSLPPEAKWP